MTSSAELLVHHQEVMNRELESGERIRWAGMPMPKLFPRGDTWTFFVFGIPWTAFALFWTGAAAWGIMNDNDGSGHLLIPLCGVPFILIGFGMLSSPIRAYRNATKTVYVITDRRAITFDGGWYTTIRSYPPDKLQEICRKEHKNGTGDVILTRRQWFDENGGRHWEDLGFLRIADATNIENLLKELANESSASGHPT